MANTYTQIHIQAVFTVQNRNCILLNSWKDELYKYISGIVNSNNHKLLAINGMPDHIHILFGFRQGTVVSSTTNILSNVGYADSVETFAAFEKDNFPTIATYAWDEAKKTVVFSTGGTANSTIKFPLNDASVVEKSTIRVYSTIEEAQAAKVHENLTLLSEEMDPVLGKVTYIFKLKPAWVFGGRPNVNDFLNYYAVF